MNKTLKVVLIIVAALFGIPFVIGLFMSIFTASINS